MYQWDYQDRVMEMWRYVKGKQMKDQEERMSNIKEKVHRLCKKCIWKKITEKRKNKW